MTLRPTAPPEEERRVDADLQARLSRLRSELAQSRSESADGKTIDRGLDAIEQRLKRAEDLARSPDGRRSGVTGDLKDQCLVAVHEVEAELCLFKPAALLYPTWTRLQESLYRFERGRREAWKTDIARLIAPDRDKGLSDTLRQRLRQLTLELHESARRYNRLAEERAAVTCEVLKLGVVLLSAFVLSVVSCLKLSTYGAPDTDSTFLSLVAGMLSGGAGAVLSRLRTLREERTRDEFRSILKWDMGLRACIGSSAALVVGAALLSGSVRILSLPDERIAQVAFFVVLGFAAGFSDRLFNVMLSRVIGTRAASSSPDRG